jgi:8-oxo-dGTP diphosphatase
VRDLPVLGVGGVVFSPAGQVLLILRKCPPNAGTWTIPGGKVEFGETLSHAVMREMFEETGLVVEPATLIEFVELIGREYHFVVADFLCHCDPDASLCRAGDDAAEIRWVPVEELGALGTTEQVQKVVFRALEMTRQARPH